MSDETDFVKIDREDELRPILQASLDQLSEAKERSLGWLAASAVGFNAGGLAAAFSLIDRMTLARWTTSLYLASLTLCFIAGSLFCWANSAMWDDTAAWFDQLKTEPEKRNASDFTNALNQSLHSNRKLFPAIAGGFCAAALTIAATVTFGIGLKFGDANNDRRCLAIQRDMLSAHPRKPDGPALFQAFGCRPQGEGSVMVPPTMAERRATKVASPLS